MAQLLKRTKKSCIKFFRKLTSSNKPSAATKLEESPVDSSQTSKCVSNEKGISNCDIPLRCPYGIRSKIAQNQNKNQNYRSSQSEAKKSTNFIVYSNYASKLDSYLNSACQTVNPSVLSSDMKSVKSFHILNEDEVSYADEDMPTHKNPSEIVFEKVRYRDNVRYFRRTPSNCSLSSHPSSPKPVQTYRECSCDPSEGGRKLEYGQRNTYTQARQSNIYLQFRNNISHPVNLTLTSNAAGNLNNLVISEGRNWLNESYPIVTWDINGNSIDDDITCLNNNWDDCDNKLNMLRDKRILRTRDGSYKSSTRSSSTTLETWVDDEILDNSFNEEIEKHFGI